MQSDSVPSALDQKHDVVCVTEYSSHTYCMLLLIFPLLPLLFLCVVITVIYTLRQFCGS